MALLLAAILVYRYYTSAVNASVIAGGAGDNSDDDDDEEEGNALASLIRSCASPPWREEKGENRDTDSERTGLTFRDTGDSTFDVDPGELHKRRVVVEARHWRLRRRLPRRVRRRSQGRRRWSIWGVGSDEEERDVIENEGHVGNCEERALYPSSDLQGVVRGANESRDVDPSGDRSTSHLLEGEQEGRDTNEKKEERKEVKVFCNQRKAKGRLRWQQPLRKRRRHVRGLGPKRSNLFYRSLASSCTMSAVAAARPESDPDDHVDQFPTPSHSNLSRASVEDVPSVRSGVSLSEAAPGQSSSASCVGSGGGGAAVIRSPSAASSSTQRQRQQRPIPSPASIAAALADRRPALVQSTDGILCMGPPPPRHHTCCVSGVAARSLRPEGDGHEVDTGSDGADGDIAHTGETTVAGGGIEGGGGTILRSDVRNEWVDATFGLDFFPVSPVRAGGGTAQGDDDDDDNNDHNSDDNDSGANGVDENDDDDADDDVDASGRRMEKLRKKKNEYLPPRQGMGLAGIKSYVAYSAVVPAGAIDTFDTPTPSSPSPSHATPATASHESAPLSPRSAEHAEAARRIGVTLSRIPLGLYVREVDAAGEAFAAGVIPGSILVDVNGLGVLAEPSHKLLERMWQYEGLFGGSASSLTTTPSFPSVMGGGGTGMGLSAGADGGCLESDGGDGRRRSVTSNGSSGGADSDGGGPADVARRGSTGMMRAAGGSKTAAEEVLNGIAFAASGDRDAASLRRTPSSNADGTVALRLIYRGEPYTSLLFASSNRSFGVSWAPCGNFALVQRSQGHAEKAGIRRGCLVAGVNGRSLRELDHAEAAAALKAAFGSGDEVRISLVYTPAASRTGYFERGNGGAGDVLASSADGGIGGAEMVATPRNGIATSAEATPDGLAKTAAMKHGSSEIKVRLKTREEQFSKPHPLEYSIGSMLTCGAGPAYRPIDDAPSREKQKAMKKAGAARSINRRGGGGSSDAKDAGQAIAELAARVAAGEVPAPFGSRSRRAVGESTTVSAATSVCFPLAGSSAPSRYKPLPPLPKSDLLSRYDSLSAALFSVRYHLSGYDYDSNFRLAGGVIDAPPPYCDDDSDDEGQERWNRHQRTGMARSCHVAGGGRAFEAICAPGGRLRLLRESASARGAGEAFAAIALPLVGMVASEEDLTLASRRDAFDTQERGCGISPRRVAEEILGVLLDLATEDDQLTQRLYFILRCFLSAAEEKSNAAMKKASATSDGAGSNGYDPVQALRRGFISFRDRLAQKAAKAENEFRLKIEAEEKKRGAEVMRSHLPAKARSRRCDDDARTKSESVRGDVLVGLDDEGDGQGGKHAGEKKVEPEAATSTTKVVVTAPPLAVNSQPTPAAVRKKPKRGMSKKLFSKMFKSGTSKASKQEPALETTKEENAAVQDSLMDRSVFPTCDKSASKSDSEGGDGTASPTPTSSEDAGAGGNRSANLSLEVEPADGDISREDVSPVPEAIALPPPPLSALKLFDNMSRFLSHLDVVCTAVEKSLLKSFSQKVADWALQPWTPSKDKVLEDITTMLRKGLGDTSAGDENSWLPLLNPVDSAELLCSVDPEECYILPSAHFPLVLSFGVCPRSSSSPVTGAPSVKDVDEEEGDNDLHLPYRIPEKTTQVGGQDTLYRTNVEVVALRTLDDSVVAAGNGKKRGDCCFIVHAAVAGKVLETGKSTTGPASGASSYLFESGNTITFDTRSSWGHPRTLSLRLSSALQEEEGANKSTNSDERGTLHCAAEEGFGWVNLDSAWDFDGGSSITCHVEIWPSNCGELFDSQGFPSDRAEAMTKMEIELKVTTELLSNAEDVTRRMLLYKHDDDMRQEMLAIDYVEMCDRILRASGLDLKLRTFRCLTVEGRKGFVEWVPGAVPLSEICRSVGGAHLGGNTGSATGGGWAGGKKANGVSSTPESSSDGDEPQPDGTVGVMPISAPGRPSWGWCKFTSLRDLSQRSTRSRDGKSSAINTVYGENPVQDFLRCCAYDPDAPYFISKDVMDTYVKSCAGYSVITYLLGVGDRHLDNLLLHANGHFLHCDYSFILGQDPKTYLPMRITEEMVLGMGGRDSDNFAKFLSLAGAAFVALRRHSNVRMLLSQIRMLAYSDIPDVSINQKAEDAILAMRQRFRLDLGEEEAISFIERLIESSISSKMWFAVDAIHSLGKRF